MTPAPASAGGELSRCLFVSDVHLDTVAGAAEAQFLHLLRTEAPQADALYILGDLFESWVGDDTPAHHAVIDALCALTAGGVGCFVLHGNRDFLLGSGFAERSGCHLLPDPVVRQFGGERVLLTHGDALCTDDHAYQELRTLVRDPLWQERFLALPLATRELLANEARAGSRAHTSRTQPMIMDVNPGSVAAAIRATGARRIIHGHTHRPAVHETEIDGEPVQRIVLGAWYEQGSCLSYEAGRYQLRALPR
ncbi:MAG: UDP-2,3-diacylglucosamine diphosphatase [Steroidobacteraceae bacterium]